MRSAHEVKSFSFPCLNHKFTYPDFRGRAVADADVAARDLFREQLFINLSTQLYTMELKLTTQLRTLLLLPALKECVFVSSLVSSILGMLSTGENIVHFFVIIVVVFDCCVVNMYVGIFFGLSTLVCWYFIES